MEQLQNGVSWLLLPMNAEFACADNIYIYIYMLIHHSFIHSFILSFNKQVSRLFQALEKAVHIPNKILSHQ